MLPTNTPAKPVDFNAVNLATTQTVPDKTTPLSTTSTAPVDFNAVSYTQNANTAGLPGAPVPPTPQKTTQQVAQKYQNYYSTVQGKQAPSTNPSPQINQAINQTTTQDPIMAGMTSAMAPIMNSLTQVLADINNPAITGQNLQQEYNQLQQQYKLPQMNAELMNMHNVMNGTVDDIRTEVTRAGGFATDSQVLGLASARNTVILKQYNALATQYGAAQQNVQNMMQYASTDQSTALQKESMTAGIVGNIQSMYANMMQMGMTMQQNNATNYRAILTAGGPQSLAESVAGNPTQQAIAERSLGLAPGTLTNPKQIDAWQADTYKTQQLQLNNYRAAVYGYNAGYGAPGGTVINNNYGGSGTSTQGTGGQQAQPTSYSQDQLTRPTWLAPNVPIYASADDMTSYAKSQGSKATLDPGTQNYVVPGVGYYVQQPNGSYALKSAIPAAPDAQQNQYTQLKQEISTAQQNPQSMSPTVMRKYSLTANAAISNFKNTGTYNVVSNVQPYLSAIKAASVNPGDKSVSDFELLDSFVKAAKGGTGQVTDSQVNVMLQGKSLGDNYQTMLQKLSTGGILAPAQRKSLVSLAMGTYQDNLNDYQKVWTAAVENMKGQGIPAQFWSNLPDFSDLFSTQQ